MNRRIGVLQTRALPLGYVTTHIIFINDPDGIRTHVTAVKGRGLNRLTTGPFAGQLLAVTGSRCLTAARTVQRPKQGSNL